MQKRIAVVGAGAAGLVAAWRLATQHDVTVYEACDSIGGHARTVAVPTARGVVDVDMGVELFNERGWPNFCALLDALKIDTFVTPLTFAACFPGGEYWQNDTYCRTPLWERLRAQCSRFQMDMHRVLSGSGGDVAGLSIVDFVRANDYSEEFLLKALLPSLAIFSGSRAPLMDFSLTYAAVCFHEHMLSFTHPPYYRKVSGGICRYIERLGSEVQEVRTSTRVEKLRRLNDRVVVRDEHGNEDTFHEVVVCTHADIALKMLEDPSATERRLLGSFEYHEASSILHRDSRVLAPGVSVRPDCEFLHTGRMRGIALDGSITRNVTKIHELDPASDPLFVTLNPQMEIDPALIIREENWKHPKLRPQDLSSKRELRKIQGAGHIWFGGLDTTLTGHESAVVCGLLLSEALGVPYPFSTNQFAAAQRAVIQDVMGVPSNV